MTDMAMRGRRKQGPRKIHNPQEPRMTEPPDKRVLRRKRQLLATNLQVDVDLLTALAHNGLVTPAGKEHILGEKPGAPMVHKLVDVFVSKPGSINAFCKILDENYFALAEEMRAEIKAEKNDLLIEDYIYDEAGKLVQKDFGNTKRLSDAEKRSMQDLVALRTQYAKEVWRLRLQKARKELENLLESNRAKDEHAAELAELVGKFVSAHRNRVNKKVATTSDPPKLMSREKTMTENMKTGKLMMETLEEHVNSLLNLTSQSLQEKDSLYDERGRALGVLEIEDEDAELDEHLRCLMSAYDAKLKTSASDADSKAEIARSLDGQIRNLRDERSREITEKDKMIDSLSEHLRKSQDRLLRLQQEGNGLQKDLSTVKVELNRIKEMVLQLETTRRLGFKFKSKPRDIDTFVSTKLKSIPIKTTTSYENIS